MLFLETVRDADRLAAAARGAHAAGKPVVAYKLGRSALGEALARSHTGALAGLDTALDAFFRDCGILRVDMLETLVEIAPLVAGRTPPQLGRAPRVAVVTTTGGGAATVADRLGLHGIETAAPDSDSPIVDLTMTATAQQYTEVLERLLDFPGCDAVLAAVGSSAQFHPQLAVEPILGAKRAAKPLAAFLTPPFELFAALGIPVVEQALARAPDFAHSIPYPVAVKVMDADHKTEAGGVALGVAGRVEFEARARKFGRDQVLVQKMERGLAEAIVGYRDDPVVGPIVLVGAGGTLAELYKDFVVELAPVSPDEAMRMIEKVKGFAAIRGYRDLPRGDVKALARAASAISRLALIPGRPVLEAEINPLIVRREGVVAVDGLAVLKE